MPEEVRILLERIADGIDFSNLPPVWQSLDLNVFSDNMSLYDYQEDAIRKALKILYFYFQSPIQNIHTMSMEEENSARKSTFAEKYNQQGLDLSLVDADSPAIVDILKNYFQQTDDRISFADIINRMSFWMATGSGKTLVLIKLIEIINSLMKSSEIPTRDILILSHREDLISQIQQHIIEFNLKNDLEIRVWRLKEFFKVKRGGILPGGPNTIDIFIYRSDLISDQEKQNLLDYALFENNGEWYVFLDEAHKGDKTDSKRQAYYSIMSRNGFLFNFSATFVNPQDIFTTVYNFNLDEYISKGYGKNIYLSEHEFTSFKDKDDFTNKEKQLIVLKCIVLLTYLKKCNKLIQEIPQKKKYHTPLFVVLAHTVNKRVLEKEPDLWLFFRELERIGNGRIELDLIETAKKELIEEFGSNESYVYGIENLSIDAVRLQVVTYRDILEQVFNASSSGSIEVLFNPENHHEAVYKLTSSDSPFALTKIGDIRNWISTKFASDEYELVERWEHKSYFEKLEESPEISILMGSRAFYEGWDTNRPNIIAFINIGVGKNARKFILQSIGRGARIEPLPNQRKRLKSLCYPGNIDADKLFTDCAEEDISGMESLFIFSTNRETLNSIIKSIQMGTLRTKHSLALEVNPFSEGYDLLIPEYSGTIVVSVSDQPKLQIDSSSLQHLKEYVEWIDDDRLLLLHHFTKYEYDTLLRLKTMLQDTKNFTLINSVGTQPKHAISLLSSYIHLEIDQFSSLKRIDQEIIHFKKIQVYLDDEDYSEFAEALTRIIKYPVKTQEIETKLVQLPREEIDKMIEMIPSFEDYEGLTIRCLAEHYYIPILHTRNETIDWITNIISVKSEHAFVRNLSKLITEKSHLFEPFKWWMFSRIKENIDEIHIPYYDSKQNRVRLFYPDFIFWFLKDNQYTILFVDPKGISHTDYEHKVDGFRSIFEKDGKPCNFTFENYEVQIHLRMVCEDKGKLSQGYKEYWLEKDIEEFLEKIVN